MPKILLIYHSNICNKNCGINSYLYNIFRILHKRGFNLDVFVPKSFDTNWETVEKDLIDNVFKREDWFNELDRQADGMTERIIKIVSKWFYNIKKLKSRVSDKTLLTETKLDWIDSNDIQRFKEVLKNNSYDYAVFSYVYYSKLLDYLPNTTVSVCSVSDFVSIQEMQHGKYKFGEVIEDEIAAISKFDKAIFISSDEMTFFSNFMNGLGFSYLPHYMKTTEWQNTIKDIDILFIGSDNAHNIRGINWFLNEVYPKIGNKNYKIVIAGKISEKVDQNEYTDILFFKYIEDLDSLYSRVKVAISPLKSGTGIKIKIIEAMSHQIPVVCTSKSLIGLIEKIDNGCIIADEAKEFSEALNYILSNEKLRQNLSLQAKNQCEKYYNEVYTENTLTKIFK